MAYHIVTTGGPGKSTNYHEYVMDSAADVSALPKQAGNASGEKTDAGSAAYIADGSKVYILSPSDTWTEVS